MMFRPKHRIVFAGVFSFVLGCAGGVRSKTDHGSPASSDQLDPPTSEPTTPSPSSASERSEIAPRPYTAEQIRDANPSGRILVYRLERAGEPTVLQETHFVEGDAEGTRMKEVVRTTDGTVVSEREATATWDELMRHATFPADATRIVSEELETPMGRFSTSRYEVRSPDGIVRLWFADELPGPPVRYENEREGELVLEAVQVERR